MDKKINSNNLERNYNIVENNIIKQTVIHHNLKEINTNNLNNHLSFKEQSKIILFLLNNIEFLLINTNTIKKLKLKSYINILLDTIPFYITQINEKFKLNKDIKDSLLINIEQLKSIGEELLTYLKVNINKNTQNFTTLYYRFIDNKNNFKKLVNLK